MSNDLCKDGCPMKLLTILIAHVMYDRNLIMEASDLLTFFEMAQICMFKAKDLSLFSSQ